MEMEMMDDEEKAEHEVDCAIETLSEAEEIKQDARLMKKIQERVREKKVLLNSVSKLKAKAAKVRADGPEKESDESEVNELSTEEDKAALQEKAEVEKGLDKLGFKPDGKRK
jgi:hypothetical protein